MIARENEKQREIGKHGERNQERERERETKG